MRKIINIHGFYQKEAKEYILKVLNDAPANVNELLIIHGSNQGNVLQQVVRKQIKHPRINKIFVTLNPGETLYDLKLSKPKGKVKSFIHD